ncbi:MAG: WbqC family protein [Muribaculaceae bacterium]|nr:WbqC family protein [Muribaculaceae bacterium]
MEPDFEISQSRQGEMVDYPPLSPSAGWCARYLKAMASGASEHEAIIRANEGIGSAKEFARFRLLDNHGQETLLPVAVEGGGRKLRGTGIPEGLLLSEHGNWRKTHLGALESILGKTPCFRYLQPTMVQIYRDLELKTLRDFNFAIFEVIISFLMKNLRAEDLAVFYNDERLKTRGKELARKINPDISVIQPVAMLGNETLLGLMAL